MLPLEMLQDMLGREYFVRVLPTAELEIELFEDSDPIPATYVIGREEEEIDSLRALTRPDR